MAAWAGDVRSQFGDAAATALEQAVARVYPEAKIRWAEKLELELASGAVRHISLPGFLQNPSETGFLFATGIEFPDERRRELEVPDRQASPEAQSRLLVFKTDAAGNLIDLQSSVLDKATPTECVDVRLFRIRSIGKPGLQVRYRTMHWRPSNVAIIEWRAAIQIDGFSVVERLPTMISMRRSDGTETSEALAVSRTTPTTVEIVGQKGRHKIAVACPEPCVLQADALLDAEW